MLQRLKAQKNRQFGAFPAPLEKAIFLSAIEDKFCHASNKAKTCTIFYRHRKHYKTYGFSCLEQLLKIDFPKEQSHHALYTPKTCMIWFRHRERYKTDDDRCSDKFLKTRVFL